MWGVQALAFGLGVAVLAAGWTTTAAEARSRHHHRSHHQAAAHSYDPPYASIVVDANTGKTLQATDADSLRHPASLTKVMTLYLLFERLQAGTMQLSTRMPVSAHAAAQAPTKLGLKPGDSITVENAIRAIVTRSANDVAVIVAEAIGGSEPAFAHMMTQKARALGMMRTTYVNASGLPDDQQQTTARDQVILGRAIQERFPKYYAYFSTRKFVFRGRTITGHNRLLAMDGVDGIKTGYTNSSGFNLITSLHRGGRHIVAAVFGGRTAAWRDARMRDLIGKYIQVASVEHTAPPIALAAIKTAPKPLPPEKPVVETASVTPFPAELSAPPAGSTAPLKPNVVRTFAVHANAYNAPETDGHFTPSTAKPVPVTTVATVKAEAPPLPPAPAPEKPTVVATSSPETEATRDSIPVSAIKRGGWLIQVGAFDDEQGAKQRLELCRSKARAVLGEADPFTEPVAKGDKTLYRARFAGLDKHSAEAACKSLKRGEIPCLAIKN
jgi:D-alanyl-D-alanine carboxypeptidase